MAEFATELRVLHARPDLLGEGEHEAEQRLEVACAVGPWRVVAADADPDLRRRQQERGGEPVALPVQLVTGAGERGTSPVEVELALAAHAEVVAHAPVQARNARSSASSSVSRPSSVRIARL